MWYAVELESDAEEVKVLSRSVDRDSALRTLQKRLHILVESDEEVDPHLSTFLRAATPQTREVAWEKVDTHWGENDIQQFFVTQSLT